MTTDTAAIEVTDAEDILVRDNTITLIGGYAVKVTNSSNVRITNNYMNTTMGKNDYAVVLGDNNKKIVLSDNTPERNEVTVTFNDIAGVVLEDFTLNINFIDSTDSSIINEGTAYLMINGEILKDTNGDDIIFAVENGQISLIDYQIPTGWLRSDAQMTIVYSGTNIYENVSLTPLMNISKRQAQVEILTTDVTANVGDTVTLQARITDGGELVTSGKVAFKLNGNSLEDESGKLIYVNVVEGIATLEYTFTGETATGSYELTAVFENMIYYRSTDSTELTIEG